MKYRIVYKTSNNLNNKRTYNIQRKTLFGWRDIKIKEDEQSNLVTFDTFEEAEAHLFSYFKDSGEVLVNNNEYKYIPFCFGF